MNVSSRTTQDDPRLYNLDFEHQVDLAEPGCPGSSKGLYCFKGSKGLYTKYHVDSEDSRGAECLAQKRLIFSTVVGLYQPQKAQG